MPELDWSTKNCIGLPCVNLQVGGAGQQGATAGAQLLSSGLSQAAATQRAAGDAASGQLTGFMNQMLGAALGSFGMPGGGPSPANIYGGGGQGVVPMLSASPGFGSPGYYAQDI